MPVLAGVSRSGMSRPKIWIVRVCPVFEIVQAEQARDLPPLQDLYVSESQLQHQPTPGKIPQLRQVGMARFCLCTAGTTGGGGSVRALLATKDPYPAVSAEAIVQRFMAEGTG
jgi:hypothetical protein